MGLTAYEALESVSIFPPVGIKVEPELVVLFGGLRFQTFFELFGLAAVKLMRSLSAAPVQVDVIFLAPFPSLHLKAVAFDDEGGVGLDGELAIASVCRKKSQVQFILIYAAESVAFSYKI